MHKISFPIFATIALLVLAACSGSYTPTSEAKTAVNEGCAEMETLRNEMEELHEDLAMTLMRGDADLAPTYEEFMHNVYTVERKMDGILEVYR